MAHGSHDMHIVSFFQRSNGKKNAFLFRDQAFNPGDCLQACLRWRERERQRKNIHLVRQTIFTGEGGNGVLGQGFFFSPPEE